MAQAPRSQRGLVRGCCLLNAVALLLLAAVVYLSLRAFASPDLGAGAQGPDHGDSQTTIALNLGAELALKLLTAPDGVITLSEHDLSVLAAAHPPDDLSGLTARVRDRLVVLSGRHPFGPFTVSPVGHLTLTLDTSKSPPHLSSQVVRLDVGQLGLPGFVRDRVLGSFASSIDLDRLFSGSPALQELRANLECVVVAPEGVRVGVHRPGAALNTGVCGS